MTNPEPTPEQIAADAAAAVAAAAEKEAADKAAAESGEDESKLPEWARTKLTKANGEAAKYRTELRAAQDALAKAKSPEDFAAATAALTEKIAGLEKSVMVEKVARKHKLPDALAARLVGATEAELEADAAELAKLVAPAAPQPPKNLKGGLDPSDKADPENDPRKLAARSRR